MSLDTADLKVIKEHIPGITVGYKNSDFIVDGTDDHVQINQALALGNLVILKDSQYNLGAPIAITSSNKIIQGQGRATKLYMQNSANATAAITIIGSGVLGVQLRNFTIDGNKANQSNGDGIYINTPWVNGSYDPNHVFSDLYILNCKNNGVEVVASSDTRVLHFNRVRVRGADGNGFYMPAPSTTDDIFDDCIAETCALNGFYIGGLNSHFVNCKAFYCGSAGGNNHGFYISGYNNYFENCEAQDNYQSGFYSENNGDATYGAQGCTFVNCVADSNGQNGGSTYAVGLQAKNVANWQVIGGVYMTRPYPDFTQRIGISIEGTATGMLVDGALFTGNTTQYSDSSSGTNVIKNTQGYITQKQGLGTVANGKTAGTVTHGLSFTPTAQQVYITPTGLGSAAKYWVSNLSSTTFTVTTDQDPGAATMTFGWRAGT
jgi:hypothetical protein